MSAPPTSPPAQPGSEHAAQLVEVTSRLAEVATPAEVADVLVTLGAQSVGVSGVCVVVALTPAGDGLELLASQGLLPGEAEAWSRFPLSLDVPVCAAVREGEEQWFRTREEYLERYRAQERRA